MKFHKHDRSGVAAVEFAMTVPFLFMFLFATYELGRANMIMHTTEAAAYEGARLAIVPGADADEVETTARNVLATAGIRNAVVTVTPRNIQPQDQEISVEIRVSFKDNTLIAPFFMKEEPVVRSCVMTRETFLATAYLDDDLALFRNSPTVFGGFATKSDWGILLFGTDRSQVLPQATGCCLRSNEADHES